MAAVLERSAFCGSSLARAPVAARGLPALSTRLTVTARGGKKISTKAPLGPSGDLSFKSGLDASGRGTKGKGVYQFTKKYGANVDGYSPIYTPDEWSPSGDVYTGGQTGLLLWAITLGGVLLAGVFLVYSTSALAS
ncbi:hypothetical protein SELMODRAFT_231914 [Selaginella moellendorffii]|uniref:Photosystem II 10 kDa polypeptide, chloroplastic n=1 Tax=Selaginella moellendorffii TaxID=88036 RepID=D8RMI9_SELML|nr:hypothetical protein SELMODRAFT_231914 [Selaginella moellendorffii]